MELRARREGQHLAGVPRRLGLPLRRRDGYDDTPGARAVWIADPGFSRFGYWCGFDQVATLIPPKAYTYADAAP